MSQMLYFCYPCKYIGVNLVDELFRANAILVGIILVLIFVFGAILLLVYIKMKNHQPEVLENASIETEFVENTGVVASSEDLQEITTNNQGITKREVDRSSFTLGVEIGSGNFGKVYSGVLTGLYGTSSQTTVAIKSIQGTEINGLTINVQGTTRSNEINDLLAEIKLMSKIKPHPNLVSLIGSCSSELETEGKLWLLMEFCEHGDLKSYLKENEKKILSGNENEALNSRCLLKWMYEVAKGMQYLEENKIMHGDLAARNILLSEDPTNGKTPLAKVADFGLAKAFYDYLRYDKRNRVLVPWKWMALEYLEEDFFTLKSDVWSYGVLLWEVLSFGRTPYGQQQYEEVLERLRSGYRLPCPDRIKVDSSWSPKDTYDTISPVCFIENPDMRHDFAGIVGLIENILLPKEKSQYRELVIAYRRVRAGNYLKTD